ncbi:hypothetical protein HK102_000679 [Quaeritorhiza haematococci]|nr:hypothetical protein HK102_000679 [Quaeritorhiza haematococci]
MPATKGEKATSIVAPAEGLGLGMGVEFGRSQTNASMRSMNSIRSVHTLQRHEELDPRFPMEHDHFDDDHPNRFIRILKKVGRALLERWFLIGLVVVVGLARAAPQIGKRGGPLKTEITASFVAVGIVFLMTGLSLKTKALGAAIMQVNVHVATQLTSLCLIPVLTFGIYQGLARSSINKGIIEGFLVMGSLPTTVSFCNVLTGAMAGNEAAALVNSALGNILGIGVTPGWLVLFLGNGGNMDIPRIFTLLGSSVVAPIIVGQIFQLFAEPWVDAFKRSVSVPHISGCSLLFIVYATFCNTFSGNAFDLVTVGELFGAVGIAAMFLVLNTIMPYALSLIPLWRFDRADKVAVTITSSHKTVALGVPLINIIFSNRPDVGLLATPVLIYYLIFLSTQNMFVPLVRSWVLKDPKPKPYSVAGMLQTQGSDAPQMKGENKV